MRYLLSGAAQRVFDSSFPFGTLTVNLLGCIIIGFLWAMFVFYPVSPSVRIFVLVGFVGAFTTFSTFALETLNLLMDGEVRYALFNIVFSNVFGLVFVFAGFTLANLIIKLVR